MAFEVRSLSGATNTSPINFDVLGIGSDRWPVKRKGWVYVVDEEREVICVQLIGTFFEMREGNYYYLFYWQDEASLIESNNGTKVIRSGHDPNKHSDIVALAKEGIGKLYLHARYPNK